MKKQKTRWVNFPEENLEMKRGCNTATVSTPRKSTLYPVQEARGVSSAKIPNQQQ
jgi:hypothetical protein